MSKSKFKAVDALGLAILLSVGGLSYTLINNIDRISGHTATINAGQEIRKSDNNVALSNEPKNNTNTPTNVSNSTAVTESTTNTISVDTSTKEFKDAVDKSVAKFMEEFKQKQEKEQSQKTTEADRLKKLGIYIDEFGNYCYVVKSGDTLASVSQKLNLPLDVMADLNEIRDVNMIYDEAVMIVPHYVDSERADDNGKVKSSNTIRKDNRGPQDRK